MPRSTFLPMSRLARYLAISPSSPCRCRRRTERACPSRRSSPKATCCSSVSTVGTRMESEPRAGLNLQRRHGGAPGEPLLLFDVEAVLVQAGFGQSGGRQTLALLARKSGEFFYERVHAVAVVEAVLLDHGRAQGPHQAKHERRLEHGGVHDDAVVAPSRKLRPSRSSRSPSPSPPPPRLPPKAPSPKACTPAYCTAA